MSPEPAVLFLLGVSTLGIAYALLALLALRAFAARRPPFLGAPAFSPPVTVLKPLCGRDPGLAENLRSFCGQDYPSFQVVFGVRDGRDPAAGIARALAREGDRCLVVDPRRHGANLKASNLANMMSAARHAHVIVADSDMRVGPDYLARVVAPLAEPGVGAVTCLYRAVPVGGVWSRLAAMYVNHRFLPAVLAGEVLGLQIGCFGATVALRRRDLERIGGFAAVADDIADDYAIGAAIRALGATVRLSEYVVDNVVEESSWKALVQHELRWARTMRRVSPLGHAASVITYPLPLALIGVVADGFGAESAVVLVLVLASSLAFTRAVDRHLGTEASLALLVPRELLSFAIYVASFTGSRVVWRSQRLRIGPGRQARTERALPSRRRRLAPSLGLVRRPRS